MARLRKLLDIRQTGEDAEKLRVDLHKRIIGQDHAIQQVVNVYQTFLAGMNSPSRPIGSFLLLGPTGTGKTRMVESMAESLVGDPRAMVKIDCAEFQHSHEIAKLVGSPPGYLGHRETHPVLSQEVLNQHHTEKVKLSFLLFDEIEKASDALWNLLLGVLDKATLTLGDTRRVDFSKTMIFMTSNLGAAEMNTILRPNLGFGAGNIEQQQGKLDANTTEKISRAGVEAARRRFTPEFMNRLDKVLVFKPLAETELRKILNLELNLLQQRIFSSSTPTPFFFALAPAAKDFLLREGTDLKYGARHLKRAIDRELVDPLSNLIASGQVRGGDLISVDFDAAANHMAFFKEAEDVPDHAIFKLLELVVSNPATAHSIGIETQLMQAAVPFMELEHRAISVGEPR
ncbi:MAG: ATP-dependent Clp protease ATP-binding subunit [Acidobacteria bacterium]|nr:MAG: ATP-dependent Clp protease ATP-binding subunit [Acidobacteriota bacterium]